MFLKRDTVLGGDIFNHMGFFFFGGGGQENFLPKDIFSELFRYVGANFSFLSFHFSRQSMYTTHTYNALGINVSHL